MTSMSAIKRENSRGFVDVAAFGDGDVPSNPTIRVLKLLHTKSVWPYYGASIDIRSMGFTRHERLILRQ